MNHKLRRTVSVFLALALSSLGWPALANPKSDNGPLTGQMVVTGSATINGKKALTGTTVFTDSRVEVACTKGNAATVNLGRLGRIELGPGAQMMVRFADGKISGELLAGKAVVTNAPGVKVAINTPQGVSATDGKDASVLAVSSQKGSRCVPVALGSSSNPALNAGQLAALIAGAGAAAVAVAVAVTNKDLSASSTLP